MTQYDTIGQAYNVLESLAFRTMEEQNIERAIKPFIKGKPNAIDFACGTGFYTTKLLDWGCNSVTGVDISQVMVEGAKERLAQHDQAERSQFLVADGAIPQPLSPNGQQQFFDIAFGCWFLNYAKSKDALLSMFKTMSLNLKSDGVLVAIVPHPANDLNTRALTYSQSPFTEILPRYNYDSPLHSGEGWNLEVILSENVRFDTFHLRQDIYEEAARQAGFRGKLEWVQEELLGAEWKEMYCAGLTAEQWRIREGNPHMAILVVKKE